MAITDVIADAVRNVTKSTSEATDALMEIPVIHIFTHDSIGVGEDGPTHQPIEIWHLYALSRTHHIATG